MEYYEQLYTSSSPPNACMRAVLDLVAPFVSADMNMFLARTFSKEEVWDAHRQDACGVLLEVLVYFG